MSKLRSEEAETILDDDGKDRSFAGCDAVLTYQIGITSI